MALPAIALPAGVPCIPAPIGAPVPPLIFLLPFPFLINPNCPFFVRYPALTRRFSLLAVLCFFLETIRPCLFINKSDFVRPPGVFLAVPCQTSALDPLVFSNIILFNEKNIFHIN